MGALTWLFGWGRRRRLSDLVGCWHLVRASDPEIERAEADFREDGRLFYSALSRDRWQVMKLTYRIEGNTIVTDQPSAPGRREVILILPVMAP